MSHLHLVDAQIDRGSLVGRRSFLRQSIGTATAFGTLGWLDSLGLCAEELRKEGRACIVLWMQGGPSQFETFDPKPGQENGGPTKAIESAVSGIRVAEHWPRVAKEMKDIALIRSMTNREGNHQRATYQLHTGYAPTATVKHPSLGSIASKELGDATIDLPHFVSIGGRGLQGISGGFLGVHHDPFLVAAAGRPPSNTALTVAGKRLERRAGFLEKLDGEYARQGGKSNVKDHQAVLGKARRLVLSSQLRAFDLDEEPDKLRDGYGRDSFGQGCLLARRLVESGVTFVEVSSNGWDTHQDNFERTKTLAGSVDSGFAQLVADLRDRGLLEKTLVLWMGEFGRTPRINGRTGRDHYPRVFNAALAGGGVSGGQVIGSSTKDGQAVKDRPVEVADLFCSICHSLKIDPRAENYSPLGRPLKVVDGGQVVNELFA
jgi:hypothetical protein